MNGKISLTCKKCNCKMEFQLKPMDNTRRIICQNCGQELLATDFNLIDAATSAINALPYESAMDGFIPQNEGFKFEIEIYSSHLPASEC